MVLSIIHTGNRQRRTELDFPPDITKRLPRGTVREGFCMDLSHTDGLFLVPEGMYLLAHLPYLAVEVGR